MTFPLVVLAVMAAAAGAFQLNDWLGGIIEGWLPEHTEEQLTDGGFKLWIALASLGLGFAGLGTAYAIYWLKALDPAKISAFLEPLPEILEKKYYLDILYQDVFVKMFILGGAGWALAQWDKYAIDGVVNGVGRATTWVSGQIRVTQAGQAQIYASVALFGAVAAIVGILLVSGS
jgi:NADH-quinone oxidoreductase subunit L